MDKSPAVDENDTSKSERKRNAKRLRDIGLKLTKLNARQLSQVALTNDLTNALAEYNRINSNEAKRRQLQFIGKLMRATDFAALESTLSLVEGTSAQARYAMHQLETWRDRLIADDSALTEYLHENPKVDRQMLRNHMNKPRNANAQKQQRAAARALFRFLRDNATPEMAQQSDAGPDYAD
jgi:ribosome-associated protein